MNIYENSDKRVPISLANSSIERDNDKCILCGACKSICRFAQGVYGNYEMQVNEEPICINCGQCLTVCPTDAIKEKYSYKEVLHKLADPNYIVIFQTAPAVRVAIGELFNFEAGSFQEGKLVSALRKLGASYVLDTTFGADLTIMEEANELIKRIKESKTLPQFTSCCPAWVRFVEIFHPELIPNLSTAKSPIMMQGSIIKTYFAKEHNLDYKKIVNVAVAPCTAKKYEITRPFNSVSAYYNDDSIKDMDYIITTKELGFMLKEKNIDFNTLENSEYDSFFGSGAGYIFGNSGGVMEAAIRCVYHLLTNEETPSNLLEFKDVRGVDGMKEATVKINDLNLNLAVISGTNNVNRLLKQIEEKKLKYDFIEVMACPGGCISGAGQPKTQVPITNEIREKRMNSLYKKDSEIIRNSYENEEIIKLYKEFLNEPLGENSINLLHTFYKDESIVKS